jgi:hypothetical protein
MRTSRADFGAALGVEAAVEVVRTGSGGAGFPWRDVSWMVGGAWREDSVLPRTVPPAPSATTVATRTGIVRRETTDG